ncbi:PREDICTED: NAD-dependent protein deacetylase Sirt2-like [Drosophila arizonae]|uniref:NAD-dependent protein deacetylase Sirt2-like n=1 Tax=Drosophila arizonae TaxID=7263 RepID=A0ABM1PDG8_DROAR|nr:PREDICTED: NAD-dependent protein deacetylase Sirt2-like [Drosophila arizonae]
MSDSVENGSKSESAEDGLPIKPSTTSTSTSTTTTTAATEEATTKQVESDSDSQSEEDGTMDMIRRFFSQTFHLASGRTADNEDAIVDKVIPELTFDGLSSYWREHGFKNIVTMVGAGISTSAGIPDFRSPGSGLYNNLKKYKLPHPTAIFDVDYFQRNPTPFFELAKELYPGSFEPTPAHYFVRLLHDKGLLQRHYTQNIDTLDRLAGLPEHKIIEAHGSFYTNHCLNCNQEYDMAWMKAKIFADELPKCEECKGLIKPDIVFFGENLPGKFYSSPEEDFRDCDLLIIMGTSLEVQPFASLIHRAGPRCVRLLINRDAVGRSSFAPWMDSNEQSLLYGKPKNTRDVAYLGDCDAGVLALAESLGWADELQQLISNGQQKTEEKPDNTAKLDGDEPQVKEEETVK